MDASPEHDGRFRPTFDMAYRVTVVLIRTLSDLSTYSTTIVTFTLLYLLTP